jgi:hypothetical protein
MIKRHLTRSKAAAPFIILIILLPYTVSFGDEDASMTVVNETTHYIHVIMNNAFLYIAPNRSARFVTDGPASVLVEVFYSPGQGISGRAADSFLIGRSTRESTCRSNSCETVNVPEGPVSWEVTPDMLQETPAE